MTNVPDPRDSAVLAREAVTWASVSLAVSGVAALFLPLTVAIALSNPIEGLIIVSTWFLGVMLALAGVVAGAVCLAYSLRASSPRQERGNAIWQSSTAIVLAVIVIAVALALALVR